MNPRETGPAVVVIGAGIIGAAVAWELARRGAQVEIFEARTPGQGATQASAGMLAPYTEARATAVFEALCIEGLSAYDDFVEALRAETSHPFEYRRSGTVEVALDQAGVAHLTREATRLADIPEARARWIPGERLRDEEPALAERALGALVVEAHGLVAAPALTQALMDAGRRRGVRVHAVTPVRRIQRVGSRYEVTGGELRVVADAVVVCAGAWAGRLRLEGHASPSVHPIRGQLLYIRPRTPLFSRILWGPRCYLVPWQDGTVLVGATVEDVGFDETTTVRGVHDLMAAAIDLVPELASAALVGVRAGLRPATADELPLLGPVPGEPRLILATGHYRNGVLLAPLTARIVADLLLEERAHRALETLGPARGRKHTSAL
ncbi:MAG TPA: glycine oxidase ThiO [Vicinamibacterales bacterium]